MSGKYVFQNIPYRLVSAGVVLEFGFISFLFCSFLLFHTTTICFYISLVSNVYTSNNSSFFFILFYLILFSFLFLWFSFTIP